MVKTSNAYIQYLLDVVFEYSQTKQSDLAGFLEYYEKKKHKLSIALPSGQNAVQIMTIHKSKGLEFPVVIFPFADLDIYKETEPKEWFPLNPDYFQGFSATLLNYNKDFEYFGETGNTIHIKRQAHLELDNMNLLYVALTRAEEQLYIISKKDITKKGEISNKTYAGLLINYLISLNTWNDNQLEYTFGHPKKVSKKEPEPIKTIEQTEFISTPKHEHQIKIVSRSGYLWDTLQEEAIEKGNLIHDIMAKINTKPDIDPVIDEFIRTHIINLEQAEVLKPLILKIVTHPELETYYSKNNTIYNERDILSKKGDIFRPDRLVINPKNEAIIIDYKTGSEDIKHSHQLNDYENVLLEMNIKTQKKILVYINDGIQIKEF